MNNFKQYKRKGALSELIAFEDYQGFMDGVSISDPDKKLREHNYEEFKKGFIARNPKNHEDLWYVAKKYFDDNLEELAETTSPGPFGLIHMGRGTFGQAIEAAKQGHKVARIGWNGAGMFAYIVPPNTYPAQTKAAQDTFGDMVPYRTYWALKTAQNDIATWAPSGSDSLAEDWCIVE